MNDGTADLTTLSTPAKIDHGVYAWEAPDTWQQGRGVFGGLVIASMIRAMQDHLGDDVLPLRSVTATLCGPVAPADAPVRLEVGVLRQGSKTSALEARIFQGGEIQAHAVGFFGLRRVEDGDWNEVEPPEDLGNWASLPVAPIGPPLAPTFTQHFAFRPVGALPFSGATTRRAAAWVQPKRPGPARDAAYLAAQIDTVWPAIFPTLKLPRPAATVAYTLQILAPLEDLDPDAPLFCVGRAPHAHDGYMVEHRMLWSPDGRPVASNQQTFAIIK